MDVCSCCGDWNDCDAEISSLCVISPFNDCCFSLWTALSASSTLFLYMMILLKLVLIVGDADESYHLQVHIGKQICYFVTEAIMHCNNNLILSVVEYSRIPIHVVCSTTDPVSNIKCKDHGRCYAVPMFQIFATLITMLLLLLAKDVETIQKSLGRY